jgi:hypothetical protein
MRKTDYMLCVCYFSSLGRFAVPFLLMLEGNPEGAKEGSPEEGHIKHPTGFSSSWARNQPFPFPAGTVTFHYHAGIALS